MLTSPLVVHVGAGVGAGGAGVGAGGAVVGAGGAGVGGAVVGAGVSSLLTLISSSTRPDSPPSFTKAQPPPP